MQSLAGGCTPQRATYGPLSDLTAAEYAEGAREYAEMLAMVQQGKDDVREEAGGSTATGKRQEWGQEMERCECRSSMELLDSIDHCWPSLDWSVEPITLTQSLETYICSLQRCCWF